MSEHVPVLLNEVITGLNIKKDGLYVDMTIGRGGHSLQILRRLNQGFLIGFDQDQEAIKESEFNLKKINDKFILIHQNFVKFEETFKIRNITYVDGVLMDLGVSSPQLDNKDRGFSYKEDARLDMRMNKDQTLDAYKIVNQYSLSQLSEIFRDYGEDKFAYAIAKNIVEERKKGPIETTLQLVDIVKRSKPMKVLSKEGHPAKQIFQALRIAVNDELNVLKKTLDAIIPYLRPHGGRLVVITFHSLEDRIVKNTFKKYAVVEGNRFDGPSTSNECEYRLVNNKPITPSEKELVNNHRSKSAKLRILERK